jgi:hypothetical protein
MDHEEFEATFFTTVLVVDCPRLERHLLHYKMKRYRCASGLCYFGLRSVSATQFGLPICVVPKGTKNDSIRLRIVFSHVALQVAPTNDRLT